MQIKSITKINKLFSAVAILILATIGFAQTTEFTYQGKLTDTGGSATNYDFEFRMCATLAGDCTTALATFSQPNVAVSSSGIFTTKIDFGFNVFSGADRFMEIRVKRSGEANYTTLAPRQKITSVPYALQSVNTQLLQGFASSDFIQDGDPRLDPSNYVQNTTTPQATATFNIGGTGTANIFNAATQFNLNGSRIMTNFGSNNLFVGIGAGAGFSAGGGNSFFGNNAGQNFLIGSNNTAVGFRAEPFGSGLLNTTAVGANAQVTQSNSLVLGSINGVNGATADTRVGIGTTAPNSKLQVVDSSNTGLRVQTNTTGGTVASFGGNGAFQVDAVNVVGGRLNILENGNVGIGNPAPQSKLSITGNGTSSNALEVNNGGIKVTGAGLNTQTPVFIVERSSANSCGSNNLITVLDNPYSNNNPNAILLVSLVLSGYTPNGPSNFYTYYAQNDINCPQFNNKWVVVVPYGGNPSLRFNVMIIKP